MIGASLLYFSAPVECAVLAKPHIHTMATSDIKTQLGIYALGTGGGVRVGNDRWIKTVAGVDTAEVNLLRCGCVGRIVSLWGAYATTNGKLAATDAARAITKVDISDSIMNGTR
jgi:hypothetical protein